MKLLMKDFFSKQSVRLYLEIACVGLLMVAYATPFERAGLSVLSAIGMSEAQYKLANLLRRSKCDHSQNVDEVIGLYKSAANRGNVGAQIELGLAYYRGDLDVGGQDFSQAFKWFHMAAAQGHPYAQAHLGIAYANGEGVQEDPVESLKWYNKAANQGCMLAIRTLIEVYEGSPEGTKGMPKGIAKDNSISARWLEKAADMNLAWAMVKLAGIYHNGEGAPKDDARALMWLQLAADQAFPEPNITDLDGEAAVIKLSKLQKNMSQEQKENADRLLVEWKRKEHVMAKYPCGTW